MRRCSSSIVDTDTQLRCMFATRFFQIGTWGLHFGSARTRTNGVVEGFLTFNRPCLYGLRELSFRSKLDENGRRSGRSLRRCRLKVQQRCLPSDATCARTARLHVVSGCSHRDWDRFFFDSSHPSNIVVMSACVTTCRALSCDGAFLLGWADERIRQPERRRLAAPTARQRHDNGVTLCHSLR